MIVFPPIKINIGLYITGKRVDGYHNLESIFVPLPWYDALEVVENGTDAFNLFLSGLPVPGDEDKNLVKRAYELLKDKFVLPGVDCYLHKAIPMGAGLGGGSSNGAFMLRLLRNKFDLPLNDEELSDLASDLGSDCPFFIYDSSCIVRGRGELLEKTSFSLRNKWIKLVNPGIHVSTAQAFGLIEPAPAPAGWIEKIISAPYSDWQSLAVNQFEGPVKRIYPEINDVLESLKSEGAFFASMTGSGSTCYGIFHNKPETEITYPAEYIVKWVNGASSRVM